MATQDTGANHSAQQQSNRRNNIVKQGKLNWFDVVTTLWAIALVVTAVMWVTTPAFAGRGEGPDCLGACSWFDECEGHGGCYTVHSGGGDCWGECGDGTEWECGYGGDV
jgi:hypothetical protein